MSLLAMLSYKLGRSIAWDGEKQVDRGRRRGQPAPPPRIPHALGVSHDLTRF